MLLILLKLQQLNLKINKSPCLLLASAKSTNSTASGKDIINLVIQESVIVIGNPFLISSVNKGITKP